MTPPSWLELLVRMTAGEQEEQPFTGILEVAGDDERLWPSTVRVFKDRDRYRVEDLDGSVLTIHGTEHVFVFADGDGYDDDVPAGVPRRHDVSGDDEFRPGAHAGEIERRAAGDWRDSDFTTPTGPAKAVTHLGHAAWEVELAPPAHKPSPLVLTIDATNGMTYEERSTRFGVLSRWTRIETVDSHDDALFEWHGDAHWYSGEWREVTDEEVETERREHVDWMAERGIGPLQVTSTVELYPHEQGEDGGFFASFDASSHGVVLRRPRSDEPWDVDADYEHMERWSDDTWDWCVGSSSDPAQPAEIRRQLVEPRRDGA